ncbi:MAG: PAS domain S-box protein [Thermoanaerobaculia bacterium]
MPSLERQDPLHFAIESSHDYAVLVLELDGTIRAWSRGAEAIVGWTEAEVVGRPFEILFREEDRAAGMPRRELERTLADGRAEDVRWHVGKGGRRFFADGVAELLRDADGSPIGIAKIFRDATQRHLTERRLATQLALSTLFAEEPELGSVAKQVMQAVCESLGWEHGELWTVDAEHDEIRCDDFWNAPSFDPTIPQLFCHGRAFARGVGLPGRVWVTGKPHWIPDLAEDSNFPRGEIAARHGVRSALAFPIVRHGAVSGVLEFFSTRLHEPDHRLLEMLEPVGAQIGDYIERRRTEAALRESEQRYRVIMETAQDAVVTIDDSSTILFANRAIEDLVGWRPDEVVGKKLDFLMPERLRQKHHTGITRYMRTGVRHIPWRGAELPGLHRDGHEVPLEISFGEWRSGGRRIFSGFMRDVSERLRARDDMQRLFELEQQAREEAERASEELARRADEEASFRHLASALTGAVDIDDVLYEITRRATLVTRADGVYVERIVSPQGEVEVRAANGRGTPEVGVRVPYPGSLTEEVLETRSPAILAAMDGVGGSMAPYLRESCGDCELLVVPLLAAEETLGALVLLNTAASGRRFHENDVTKAKTLGDLTSLALRRVRTVENERQARATAEAAVRSRDRTLGIVSHDLRNPLTKISLAAQILEDIPEEERKEQIELVRTATQQMERLIADLLDAARIERRGLDIRAQPIDLPPVLDQACASNRVIAAQRRQVIACARTDGLPRVLADADRVLQVLNNLVGNAIKFTRDGGRITITTRVEDDRVVISVADEGPGFPPGKEREAFESRWQAPDTAHLGAGLGLSIVKGIVEAHDGDVWASNGETGGAVISFTLPIAGA